MASHQQRKVPVAHVVTDIGGTPQQEAMLEKAVNALTIAPEYLEKICQHFVGEMLKGLNKEEQTVAMIPSFVEGRLTGEEVGSFLALDLGGTNLRVVLVELKGRGNFTTKSTKYKVSETLKTGDVKELYSKCFGGQLASLSVIIFILVFEFSLTAPAHDFISVPRLYCRLHRFILD